MNAPTIRDRRPLRAAAAVAAVAAALAGAPAAEANSCKLSNGVLDVTMTGGGTTIRSSGGAIIVGHNGPLTCTGGLPTTKNVDVIRVVDAFDDSTTSAPLDGSSELDIRDPVSFAPGRTPEDTPNRSEIEFVVNMNGGARDRLLVIPDAFYASNWEAGTTGVNWNGDADPDLNVGSFDALELRGTRYADRISARGGGALGAPLSLPKLKIWTAEGDDTVLGGDTQDELDGGLGADTISGFGGDDDIEDPAGDDSIDGGAGTDKLSLSWARPAATVDLGRSGAQDTGAGMDTIDGVESVIGGDGDDVLIGDESSNYLGGGRGDDTFDGRGGPDVFDAYDGSDTVVYESSANPVSVDLVTGTGSSIDATDKFYAVENVVGSPFADTLVGDGLANRLVGGAGTDTITAAGGPDRVEVRDGERDRVQCGDDAAVDSVLGDRRGVDDLSGDCETLDLLPEPAEPVEPVEPTQPGGGGGPGGPGPEQPGGGGTDTSVSLSLGGSRAQRILAQRAVRVQVRCPAEACNASVSATASIPRSGRGTRSATRLELRSASASLAAGAKRTVVLRLTRAQLAAVRRALAAKRTPTVKVVARASDAAGNRAERTLRVRGKR